jgi:hypothetical protein
VKDPTLIDIIRYFKSKKSLIINNKNLIFLLTILGFFIGVLYSYNQNPMYKAEISFILESPNDRSNNQNLYKEVDIEVLAKSRYIIEKTLNSKIEIDEKTTTLSEYYMRCNNSNTNDNEGRTSSNTTLSLKKANKFLYQQDSIVEKIYRKLLPLINIKIKDKDNAFSKIEIINENQLFAKLFCIQLVSTLDNYFTEISIARNNKKLYPFRQEVDSLIFSVNNLIVQNAFIADNLFGLNKAMEEKSAVLNSNSVLEKIYIENQVQMRQNLLNAKFDKELIKNTNSIMILDEPRLPLIKIKTSAFTSILISSFSLLLLTILCILIKSHC